MNSQFTPGLSESFARQQHQRLLDEAANARLIRRAGIALPAPVFFTLKSQPRKPAKAHTVEATPQPSVRTAAFFAALTAFLAFQIALLVAL